MESRTLGFVDAMRLAQILGKYIDTVSLGETPLDFIENLIDKIDPTDYIKILFLLSNELPEDIAKHTGKEVLALLYSGLEKNKILSLFDAYKTIGFTCYVPSN